MSKQWSAKLTKAEKFLSEAHAHGGRVYARYKDDRGDSALSRAPRANLFYSGVQTLKESLFNSLPKADVSRINRDADDDIARVAGLIMQRGLNYEVQCADDFKGSVRSAILDRLVPGIGTVWVRFEMETTEEGSPMAGSEAIFIDSVYWEDFLYQPSRTWKDVTWVARKLPLTKKEIVARWGEDAMDQVESEKNKTSLTPKEITDGKYIVYEIWDKSERKVIWTTKGGEKCLEEKDDPYGLKDFFPCPPPLIANTTTTAYLPVTDYHQSQDQYNQLDILYARIAILISAIKVAGCYNGAEVAIGRMFESAENTLIPVDNWAMFTEAGGTAGGIQWYPVEQVASVLQMLQQQYEHIKAVLFEVSGLSDIQRGVTNQYETAEAQKIKAQFASGRMSGYQRDVSEFVSAILNIMGEMVVQLYSDEKLQQIVGRLSDPDMMLVPKAIELLRNDELSSYRIVVQADSLVQADWALEKTQRMELMGYVSQFLQSAVPAMQTNPDLGQILLTMFKFTLMGYRGASEIEGVLDAELERLGKQAQAPKPPPPPSPEEIAAQQEQAKMQAEMQLKQQEAEQKFMLEQQQLVGRMELEKVQAEQDAAIAKQKAELEAELAGQKLAMDAALENQRMEFAREKHEQDMAFAEQKFAMEMMMKERDAANKAEADEDAKEKADAEESKKQEESEKESGGNKDALEALTKALTAPKRIIKDANGVPVGIERVMGEED